MKGGRGTSKGWLLRVVLGTFAVLAGGSAAGLELADLSNRDATAGVKAALARGSEVAVAKLGVPDGFLSNPKVKIPLPGVLKQAESALRMLGMGKPTNWSWR